MPTDLDKLQGTWTVTSVESQGKKMPAAAIGTAQIVIAGRRFTSTGMGADYEGTVELRPAKKGVSEFDLFFTAGPPKGTRNRGIRWAIVYDMETEVNLES